MKFAGEILGFFLFALVLIVGIPIGICLLIGFLLADGLARLRKPRRRADG